MSSVYFVNRMFQKVVTDDSSVLTLFTNYLPIVGRWIFFITVVNKNEEKPWFVSSLAVKYFNFNLIYPKNALAAIKTWKLQP